MTRKQIGSYYPRGELRWDGGVWRYVLYTADFHGTIFVTKWYLKAVFKAWRECRNDNILVYVYSRDGTLDGIFYPRKGATK